ncbi:unnamed protein product [Trifolium pratense]|uniref:Uncharacterized protein n=1 Tax=Trifolium pratense TaxID=57577 RepID=A0ACB0JCC9_TRIPR|nr:unnamed protein product [Trifolium pratense]
MHWHIDKGGLGIKNLDLFNQALLCKWKWRGLSEDNTLWCKLLVYRYGSMAGNFLLDVNKNVRVQSIWWRDILRIGGEESGGWFKSNVCNVLGSGNLIRFWQERWLGHESFMNLFPQLYAKSLQPDAPIAAFGSWSDDNWTWSFDWAVELARDDMDAATEMSILLADIRP